MRINHNISSMTTQNSMSLVNRSMSKSLERLSTGLRINRASDDAAGLGVSENLRTQVKGTSQALRNAQDGISALNIAEGAANEISEILQRMRELAVQSSSDTLTSTERAYTNNEFTALRDEINRIAEVTNYNKLDLINGEGTFSTEAKIWIDANATTNDSLSIKIDSLKTDGGSLSAINTSALGAQSSAVNAITAIDNAINQVNTMRSNMGTYINRLEHAINNLMISNTNQQSAESTIRDVDFASESSQFTRNQILTQSGTAMLSQANMIPQNVLSLLG
ncbi:MAG: flagellin [Fibrobacter sp.]|nr:flagellin [Fibrobacter sp.]